MESKLLLYFGTNIIVPVSCDATGRTHETEAICYSAIPDYSHIDAIREFYQTTTGVSVIDTHFVFLETLETSFKKQVIESFAKEGLRPKSFTVLPSLILTDYALKQIPSGDARFGEHVVVIYSNDESLVLTGTVSDGNAWQWNVSQTVIPKVGNSPLKRSLVECLINERDKRLGAIDERNREREIEYQMQFADEWLAAYKQLESRDDLIVDFKFSFEDTYVKLRIPKREIEQSYERTLAPAISSIAAYREKKCSNAVKYAILVGPAFEEENFTEKVKIALECHEQFSVIPHSRLSLVLSKYLDTCTVEENFAKFDQIAAEKNEIYKNSLEWIQHAQVLTEFDATLTGELKELTQRVAEDTRTLEAVLASTHACLKKSAFQDAREALGKAFLPSTLTSNSRQAALVLLAKRENMEGMFAKMERADGARPLIFSIKSSADQIRAAIATSDSHQVALKEKAARIDHCEEHYDEYLILRREFDNTTDYTRKKALIPQIQAISDEELPALKLRQVFAEITYTKEKVKAGLFKKKDVIEIQVNVLNGDVLPCEAILNLSNKVLIRSSEGEEGCMAFEIDKGESSFSASLDSANDKESLDFSKPIHCYLFVGKRVLDKAAIKCDHVLIK